MSVLENKMLNDNGVGSDMIQYVIVVIGGQLFGFLIFQVYDVFVLESVIWVLMLVLEVQGVLNFCGWIVIVINMCCWLYLFLLEGEQMMVVGIEYKQESYGFVIDIVGEVLILLFSFVELNLLNFDWWWVEIVGGVYCLDGQLMVIFDVDWLFGFMFIELMVVV